jgi:hypothetical protein
MRTASSTLHTTPSAPTRTALDVSSAEERQLIERLAYAASLFSDFSYAESLEHFELALCPHLRRCDAELQQTVRRVSAKTCRGIPLMSFAPLFPDTLVWLALTPLMLIYAVMNVPQALAGLVARWWRPDRQYRSASVGTGIVGAHLYRYFRQLSVAVYNALFARAVLTPLLKLTSELRRSLGGTYG